MSNYSDKHLHIVAPDFPLPSDAGILKDLVFMVRGLHANGVNIHLHCFGDGNRQGLNSYCHSIHCYEKKQGHEGHSLKIPHAASTRSCDSLTSKLMMDNHPILFAGFQTVYPLLDNALTQERSVTVRVGCALSVKAANIAIACEQLVGINDCRSSNTVWASYSPVASSAERIVAL